MSPVFGNEIMTADGKRWVTAPLTEFEMDKKEIWFRNIETGHVEPLPKHEIIEAIELGKAKVVVV
jgi:hypothetical protein